MLVRYIKTQQQIFIIVLLSIFLPSFRALSLPNLIYYNIGNAFQNHALTATHMSSTYARKAEIAFRQVGELHNQEASAHLMQQIGISLLLQNEKEKSFSILRKIPDGADYLLQLGHNAYAQERFEKAIYWFQIASEIWPEQREALFFLGRTYSKQGNLELALSYYERAVDTSIISSASITTAEIYCTLGWSYHWLMDKRDPVQALEYYDLGIASNSAKSYDALDDCYFKRGSLLIGYFDDMPGAIADFKFATMLRPENVHAQANLILAEYAMLGDFEVAEQKLFWLIEREPKSIYGYWRLGDLYIEEKREGDAYIQYKFALDNEPNNQQLQQIVRDLAP